jgi:Na+-transporting methylmalonyl-CoA/oxaloacetate decarboxylase gamma subunit
MKKKTIIVLILLIAIISFKSVFVKDFYAAVTEHLQPGKKSEAAATLKRKEVIQPTKEASKAVTTTKKILKKNQRQRKFLKKFPWQNKNLCSQVVSC